MHNLFCVGVLLLLVGKQIHSRPAWLRPLSIDDPIAYQFSEGPKSCRSMYSVLIMHHNTTILIDVWMDVS